jgi:hypothetical protein
MITTTLEAFPIQSKLMELVWDGRYRYIALGGGIRSSKSWSMLIALISLCRVFPGSRWAVVRKDLERLRKTTLPSFNKLRRTTGRFVGPVNMQTFEAHCTNGSAILFRGENIDRDPDLDSFDGYEVNGFVLEEADELQLATFHKSIERAGAWVMAEGEQPPPLVFSTFNPNAAWPKEVFFDPWEQGTIAPPYAYLPATIADNPAIPAAYRESLKSLPIEEYEVRVGGDWTKLSGRFYRSLNRAIHVIPRSHLPEVLPDWWEYWGGYDWGYDHWAVFGAWCKDPDGVRTLLDSCWLRREQDDEQAKTIYATMPAACLQEVYAGQDCWASVTARGGSGITTAEVFEEHGISLWPADTDRVNGSRAVRRALEVRQGRAGVYLVETPGNLRVFNQLSAMLPDPNNINKPAKIDCDAHGRGGDDGADMFRYAIATRIDAPHDPYLGDEVAEARAKLDQVSRKEAEKVDAFMEKLVRRRNRES